MRWKRTHTLCWHKFPEIPKKTSWARWYTTLTRLLLRIIRPFYMDSWKNRCHVYLNIFTTCLASLFSTLPPNSPHAACNWLCCRWGIVSWQFSAVCGSGWMEDCKLMLGVWTFTFPMMEQDWPLGSAGHKNTSYLLTGLRQHIPGICCVLSTQSCRVLVLWTILKTIHDGSHQGSWDWKQSWAMYWHVTAGHRLKARLDHAKLAVQSHFWSDVMTCHDLAH